ncbi:hypothetical protein FRC10_010759 [Ceratobasidium sp. 414]|nr:hypothetical protein FRC10_010759 [Ceratobasidium sp. 414]
MLALVLSFAPAQEKSSGERERADLVGFLSPFAGGSSSQSSGVRQHSAAYVSGAPGTGKTALVSEVLRGITADGYLAVILQTGTNSLGSVVVLDELDFILQTPSALFSIFALRTRHRQLYVLSPTKAEPADFLTLDVPTYTAEDIVKIVQGRLAPLMPSRKLDPLAPAVTPAPPTGASLVIAPSALMFLAKKLAEQDVNPFAPTVPSNAAGPSIGPTNSAGIATMKHVLDVLRGRDGLAAGQT